MNNLQVKFSQETTKTLTFSNISMKKCCVDEFLFGLHIRVAVMNKLDQTLK